jgi:hypothetical protein
VRVFAFLIILSLSLHSISLLKILARGQPLLLNRRRRIKVVAPTHEPEAGAVRDKRKVGLPNSARVREVMIPDERTKHSIRRNTLFRRPSSENEKIITATALESTMTRLRLLASK